MGCTIHPAAQKPQRFGRFSSPLRRLGRFWFLPFIGRHSLSHAHSGVPAPSEREPGTAAPFIVPPGNRNVAGDFHRPYENSETIRPRFPPGERYRVGQGTTVWEPAKSVTKRGRVGKLSPGGNHADCVPGGQSGHGPGGTSLYRQLRNEKAAAVNIPPQPIFCAKSSLPPYLQEPDTQPILSSYPDFAPHRPAAPPSQG